MESRTTKAQNPNTLYTLAVNGFKKALDEKQDFSASLIHSSIEFLTLAKQQGYSEVTDELYSDYLNKAYERIKQAGKAGDAAAKRTLIFLFYVAIKPSEELPDEPVSKLALGLVKTDIFGRFKQEFLQPEFALTWLNEIPSRSVLEALIDHLLSSPSLLPSHQFAVALQMLQHKINTSKALEILSQLAKDGVASAQLCTAISVLLFAKVEPDNTISLMESEFNLFNKSEVIKRLFEDSDRDLKEKKSEMIELASPTGEKKSDFYLDESIDFFINPPATLKAQQPKIIAAKQVALQLGIPSAQLIHAFEIYKKEPKNAFLLLKKAAEAGNFHAQNMLACIIDRANNNFTFHPSEDSHFTRLITAILQNSEVQAFLKETYGNEFAVKWVAQYYNKLATVKQTASVRRLNGYLFIHCQAPIPTEEHENLKQQYKLLDESTDKETVYQLALYMYEGVFIKASAEEIFRKIEKAALLNHDFARFIMSYMMNKISGVEVSIEHSGLIQQPDFNSLCAIGDKLLADSQVNKIITTMNQELEQALNGAAKELSGEVDFDNAMNLLDSSDQPKIAQGKELLLKAVNKKYPPALSIFAQLLAMGEHFPEDLLYAYNLLKEAYAKEDVSARCIIDAMLTVAAQNKIAEQLPQTPLARKLLSNPDVAAQFAKDHPNAKNEVKHHAQEQVIPIIEKMVKRIDKLTSLANATSKSTENSHAFAATQVVTQKVNQIKTKLAGDQKSEPKREAKEKETKSIDGQMEYEIAKKMLETEQISTPELEVVKSLLETSIRKKYLPASFARATVLVREIQGNRSKNKTKDALRAFQLYVDSANGGIAEAKEIIHIMQETVNQSKALAQGINKLFKKVKGLTVKHEFTEREDELNKIAIKLLEFEEVRKAVLILPSQPEVEARQTIKTNTPAPINIKELFDSVNNDFKKSISDTKSLISSLISSINLLNEAKQLGCAELTDEIYFDYLKKAYIAISKAADTGDEKAKKTLIALFMAANTQELFVSTSSEAQLAIHLHEGFTSSEKWKYAELVTPTEILEFINQPEALLDEIDPDNLLEDALFNYIKHLPMEQRFGFALHLLILNQETACIAHTAILDLAGSGVPIAQLLASILELINAQEEPENTATLFDAEFHSVLESKEMQQLKAKFQKIWGIINEVKQYPERLLPLLTPPAGYQPASFRVNQCFETLLHPPAVLGELKEEIDAMKEFGVKQQVPSMQFLRAIEIHKKDPMDSFNLIRAAAEGGNFRAQFMLASLIDRAANHKFQVDYKALGKHKNTHLGLTLCHLLQDPNVQTVLKQEYCHAKSARYAVHYLQTLPTTKQTLNARRLNAYLFIQCKIFVTSSDTDRCDRLLKLIDKSSNSDVFFGLARYRLGCSVLPDNDLVAFQYIKRAAALEHIRANCVITYMMNKTIGARPAAQVLAEALPDYAELCKMGDTLLTNPQIKEAIVKMNIAAVNMGIAQDKGEDPNKALVDLDKDSQAILRFSFKLVDTILPETQEDKEKAKKEAQEREEKTRVEREARERAEKERAERETQEREEKARVEREARERTDKERAEREAKEREIQTWLTRAIAANVLKETKTVSQPSRTLSISSARMKILLGLANGSISCSTPEDAPQDVNFQAFLLINEARTRGDLSAQVTFAYIVLLSNLNRINKKRQTTPIKIEGPFFGATHEYLTAKACLESKSTTEELVRYQNKDSLILACDQLQKYFDTKNAAILHSIGTESESKCNALKQAHNYAKGKLDEILKAVPDPKKDITKKSAEEKKSSTREEPYEFVDLLFALRKTGKHNDHRSGITKSSVLLEHANSLKRKVLDLETCEREAKMQRDAEIAREAREAAERAERARETIEREARMKRDAEIAREAREAAERAEQAREASERETRMKRDAEIAREAREAAERAERAREAIEIEAKDKALTAQARSIQENVQSKQKFWLLLCDGLLHGNAQALFRKIQDLDLVGTIFGVGGHHTLWRLLNQHLGELDKQYKDANLDSITLKLHAAKIYAWFILKEIKPGQTFDMATIYPIADKLKIPPLPNLCEWAEHLYGKQLQIYMNFEATKTLRFYTPSAPTSSTPAVAAEAKDKEKPKIGLV